MCDELKQEINEAKNLGRSARRKKKESYKRSIIINLLEF